MSLIFTVFKLTVLIGIVIAAVLFAWSYLSPCVYRSKVQAIDEIKESFDSGENYALICVCLMAVYYFGGIACTCTCLLAGGLYLLDMLSDKAMIYENTRNYRGFAIVSVTGKIIKLLIILIFIIFLLYVCLCLVIQLATLRDTIANQIENSLRNAPPYCIINTKI